MSVITELTVEADAFVLGEALQAVPEMYVEGERMVTHSDECVLPFLTATGGSFEEFERAAERDDSVADFVRVDSFEGTNRYRFLWDDEFEADIRDILDQKGMVIGAAANADTWHLEIEYTDRAKLSDLQQCLDGDEQTFTLERLYEPEHPGERAYQLTAEQHETLLLAHEMGYFSVPREASMEDLADELDISPGAVSERLRRGSDRLVRNTLSYEQG